MTSPFSVQDSVSKKKRTGVVELTSWNMSLVSLKLTLIHFHVPMIFPWHSHYIPIIFRWYCHDSFPWWYSPRYSGDIPMIFPWYFHDISMICPFSSQESVLIWQLSFRGGLTSQLRGWYSGHRPSGANRLCLGQELQVPGTFPWDFFGPYDFIEIQWDFMGFLWDLRGVLCDFMVVL